MSPSLAGVVHDFRKLTLGCDRRGDVRRLADVTCDGLFRDFLQQISARKGERMDWKILSYKRDGVFGLPLSEARTLSDRAVAVPVEGLQLILRQIVVRITSTQRLDHYERRIVNGKPQMKQIAGKPHTMQENVVLQKLYIEGKESPWKVWGTTEDTTPEDLEKAEWQLQESFLDKLKRMWHNRA